MAACLHGIELGRVTTDIGDDAPRCGHSAISCKALQGCHLADRLLPKRPAAGRQDGVVRIMLVLTLQRHWRV